MIGLKLTYDPAWVQPDPAVYEVAIIKVWPDGDIDVRDSEGVEWTVSRAEYQDKDIMAIETVVLNESEAA